MPAIGRVEITGGPHDQMRLAAGNALIAARTTVKLAGIGPSAQCPNGILGAPPGLVMLVRADRSGRLDRAVAAIASGHGASLIALTGRAVSS
jgi:hypothetical protein